MAASKVRKKIEAYADGVGCPGNTVVPALGCPEGQACNEGACVAAVQAEPTLLPNGAQCGTIGRASEAQNNSECASGVCGIDNSWVRVCENPNPLGARCNVNSECISGVCRRSTCA